MGERREANADNALWQPWQRENIDRSRPRARHGMVAAGDQRERREEQGIARGSRR